MYLSTRDQTQQQHERRITAQIREHGAAWVQKQQFWLFGTAVYHYGMSVSEAELARDARHFFNVLDKWVLTRRQINEGCRLPRLVFREAGRSRANLHFHFFIKGLSWQHYASILGAAPEIWYQRIDKAHQLEIKDNLGSSDSRSGYGWKEFRAYSDETLLTECCHL